MPGVWKQLVVHLVLTFAVLQGKHPHMVSWISFVHPVSLLCHLWDHLWVCVRVLQFTHRSLTLYCQFQTLTLSKSYDLGFSVLCLLELFQQSAAAPCHINMEIRCHTQHSPHTCRNTHNKLKFLNQLGWIIELFLYFTFIPLTSHVWPIKSLCSSLFDKFLALCD